MKKHLNLALRLVVSVGILAYLLGNICLDVAQDIAAELLKASETEWQAVAQRHDVNPTLAQMIRQHGVVDDQGNVNLKHVPWVGRERFVWTVGPHEVVRTFRRINLSWFAAGVACFGIVCLIGTLRWRMILQTQGLNIPVPRAMSIFFIGHFFNAFMLGATGGDVIKAWYAAHETHHKKAEAVATVIVDRIIGLMALFVIALAMMAIYYRRVFEDPKMISFAIITIVIVAATVVGTAMGFWKGFADKLPGLRGWLQRLPKYDLLRRMVEAYRTYATHPRLIGQTMLLSFAVHFFVMLSVVCVGYGLKIAPANGLVDYFLYLPIINTVAAVPISISGFGVREGMFVAMFGEVGVTKAAALALSLLGYVVSLVWSVVGGIFFLTHRKELPPTTGMAATE